MRSPAYRHPNLNIVSQKDMRRHEKPKEVSIREADGPTNPSPKK